MRNAGADEHEAMTGVECDPPPGYSFSYDPPCGYMFVTLNGGAGQHTIKCVLSNTVLEFKCFIQDKEGTPPDEQMIILGGKELDDMTTFSELGIPYGVTLNMWLRPRLEDALDADIAAVSNGYPW